VATVVAMPMRGFHRVVKPLRMLLAPVSRRTAAMMARRPEDSTYVSADELKMLVELSHQQGLIHSDVRHMIKGVVGLGNRLVKEVMVPRTDMAFFDLADTKNDFIELVLKTRHKRFPACEGSVDNVVGLIHAGDVFLDLDKSIRQVVRPALFVPETKTIESMLHDFRETRRQTAIVLDEYGGVVGLITTEDILEEIVGEIRDEFEPHEPAVRMAGHNTYEVSGQMSTRMWRDVFGLAISSPDFNTVGGFVISLLGRAPREGDSVQYSGFELTIESVRHNRIRRLKVHVPNGQTDLTRLRYE
jgi:CBS domain containing-hemolysin-like protein